jgi:uncharacterized protein (TIGR03435 family)
MKALLVAIGILGTLGIVAAQQDTAPAAFEVASVKANRSGDSNGSIRQGPGGRVDATNMPLRPMITLAYGIAGYQLIGGPGWIDDARYDIVAKLEDGGAGSTAFMPGSTTTNPTQRALQKLLEDRFRLKTRRETREMDIYALVMARPGGAPGPNLKPSTQDCAAAADAARRGVPPPSGPDAPFCGIQGQSGRLRFGGLHASAFPQALSGRAGRMVVDRTGLTGSWDFELTYTPDTGPGGNPDRAIDPNAPSFFTAVQEQLGLKLESTKGPVEVMVIDSIERPMED